MKRKDKPFRFNAWLDKDYPEAPGPTRIGPPLYKADAEGSLNPHKIIPWPKLTCASLDLTSISLISHALAEIKSIYLDPAERMTM